MLSQLILTASLLSLIGVTVNAADWRGIVPLVSSRRDVEAKLGRPKTQGKFVSSYEFPDEFVDVYYSSGPPCGNGLNDSWRVKADVVVSIRVVPKQERRLVDIVSDSSKFQRTVDPIKARLWYYSNSDSGVRYTVEKEESLSEIVLAIDYGPRTSQSDLRCTSTKLPNEIEKLGTPFDRYSGSATPSTRRAVLDNFAIQLTSGSGLHGIIVIYSVNNRQASVLGRQARSYLTNVRGISSSRLTLTQMRQAKHSYVELYLLQADKLTQTGADRGHL